MATDDSTRSTDGSWIPAALVALAVAVFVAQTGTNVVNVGPSGLLAFENALGVVLSALFSLIVIGGVLWHRRRGLPPDRYHRLAKWVVGFGAVVLALNLVMIAAWTTGSTYEDLAWAIQAAAMGIGAGMLFGSIEARAIERAVEAERAATRSEQLEAQREWLEYLNSLLRHEVLNTANVIVGYAELLIEDHDGDERSREHLERIARQSQKMTDVIQDVRLLIQATNEEVRLETVDVVSVLESEVTALEDRHGDVTVTTDCPDSAAVTADDLLARVFSNLLDNAVVHNDSEVPRVEVGVEADPETVTVTIADNGPGVPEDERSTLFERSGKGDHGLGLYLVRTLLGRYEGSIEIAETGPDGSTFVVELPRASVGSATTEGTRAVAAEADGGQVRAQD